MFIRRAMVPGKPVDGLKLFVLLFFILFVDARHHHDRGLRVLSRILGGKSKPVVLLLNPGQQRSYDFEDFGGGDFRSDRSDGSDRSDRSDRSSDYSVSDDYIGNQDTYLVYNLLRTTQDNEDLDSSAENKFEDAKELLRPALRARCQKLDSCVQKCPPKKPACEHKCQKIFDKLNACEEPTTTCRTTTKNCRTGKTMPPRWKKDDDKYC